MRRIKHLTHIQLATLSEHELESRRAACVARGRTWSIVCVAMLMGALGLAVAAGLRISTATSAMEKLVLLLTPLALAIHACVVNEFCGELLTWAKGLVPLAESESGCLELLAAARKYPEIQLWVDAAVSNGRQLRAFDLAAAKEFIARAKEPIESAEALRKEAMARQRKELHDAACKELHGVSITS